MIKLIIQSIFSLCLVCSLQAAQYQGILPESRDLYREAFNQSLTKNILDTLKEKECRQKIPFSYNYYLYVADFIESFIEIPTSNVSDDSSTISSTYLAGRAPLYNEKNEKVGICSASFLCMQNDEGIFNDISNYIMLENGLIVTWFTPTTLINLELDSIVNSMVTECIVLASTKVGVNPFYGKTYTLIVSSDSGKINFNFSPY